MVEKISLFETKNHLVSWQKLAKAAINDCPKIKKEREREILAARFGIGTRAKTLQAIGDKHNITRERVRQVVNNSIQKIKKNCASNEIKALLKEIETAVSQNGGYASTQILTKRFTDNSESEKNAFTFVVNLSSNLENVKTSNFFNEGWRTKKIKTSDLKNISIEALKILKGTGHVMKTSAISDILGKDKDLTQAAMSSSKNLMQDDKKNWGLKKWPHVNPRSIRDKAKYIMSRHGKPMHYSALAEEISKLGSKKVTKQSVHNELIKNNEFVLVGRGIYALAEWGYKPGIVEEVIVNILKEAGKPLAKEAIIEKVLEHRIVKPSTIVLNLQRPRFKKVGNTTYGLK